MADSYEEEIKQKMNALPASIRDYIYSSDMDATIRNIGTKHQLHIDQVGALSTEAAAVMIGVSETKNFTSEIADSLNVNAEKAAAIAEDVNREVFLKIREAMKKGPPAAPVQQPSAQISPAANIVKINTPPPPAAPKPVPPPAPAAPAAPKPAQPHPADLMLTQKTVSVAPAAPKPPQPPVPTPPKPAAPSAPAVPKPPAPPAATPQPYKTDPYREPTN